MIKRMSSNFFLNWELKSSLPVLQKKLHTKIPTKEIEIPFHNGHISAKLWGNSETRPLLALHGWQDNAGTWDTLAPMLINKDRSILAIDFPGHGLSSWIPPGMMYYEWDHPSTILYLKKYFQWEKISVLSHSMGAIATMRYASIKPDDVDLFIAVDSLIHDRYSSSYLLNRFHQFLDNALIAQDHLDKQIPTYTMEEIKQLWHKSTNKSVALESVQYLAKRGIRQLKEDPTKYYFSRDYRLKYAILNPENKQFLEPLVSRQKCPTLYIKATESPYSADKHVAELRDLVAQNNKNFELHFVPGTHHVHLNNPERLAPLILNFLDKYT